MNMHAYSDVWDALADTPEQAEGIKIRSDLMMAINDHLEKTNGARTMTAQQLGITQPRLNDLLQGRIGNFSLDALIIIAVNAGLKVSVHAKAA